MTIRTGAATVLSDVDLARHTLPADDTGLGCLGTERGNLPLTAIDVRSDVTGLAVRTVLTQTFRNPCAEPLEATYIFPLPDRAAVTALRMTAADRVVEGILKEREQARAEYDLAISEGKRASIAEEERPGVFTLRVGNIMPGESVAVETTLTGRLPFEDGAATYRFPLVVAPRFVPGVPLAGDQVGDGVAADTDAVPDASRISPPVLLPGFPNPVRLGIRVAVDPAGLGLREVRSSLHGVEVAEGSGPAGTDSVVVTLADPGERANRDFVLRLRYGAGDAVSTSLAVQPDPVAADGTPTGEGTFLLTLLPPDLPAADTAAEGTDVVVVLDRSGSMEGWKMVAARRAAARIVDTLTDRDRFQILAFDDSVESPDTLDAGLVWATDRHRFRAVEYLAKVDARGGTWFLDALRRAGDLLSPAAAGGTDRAKALVLVTDGQVGNEDEILGEMKPLLSAVRVHTLGVDRAVNEGFLRRLARTSGGRYELVESEDRLDEAMAAIHRRIAGPVLTGLRLAAAGLEIDPDSVEPARLPDLFPGAPAVISGRYRNGGGGTAAGAVAGSLVVRGELADPAEGRTPEKDPDTIAGTPWAVTLPATAPAAGDAPVLGAYWARGRVRDLEDRYLVSYGDKSALEREIVATSLRFGVLCRFTAFVAVDHRIVNPGGDPRRVTNPVDAPQGWDMLDVDSDLMPDFLGFEKRASALPMEPPHVTAVPCTMPPPPSPSAPAPVPAPAAPGLVPPAAAAPLMRLSAPAPGAPMPQAAPPPPPMASGGYGMEAARRRMPKQAKRSIGGPGGGFGAAAAPQAERSADLAEEGLDLDVASTRSVSARPVPTSQPPAAAALAAKALAELRAADPGTDEGRAALLDALAAGDLSRLRDLLVAEGDAEAEIRVLTDLLARLADPLPDAADPLRRNAELSDRRAAAIEVLERIAGGGAAAQSAPPRPAPGARKPFWKR